MKPMKPRSADPTRTALLLGLMLGLMLGLVAAPAFAQDDYEGDAPGECTDRADNDRDGLYDCDDPDCANSPDCKEGASPVPAPAAAPIPDTELRSEEGFVFPSPTALADYRARRVGLRTTEDQNTVAWGVGGIAGFGAAGVVSGHRSTAVRLLRIDGTGATYGTDSDFMGRLEQRDWHQSYLSAHRTLLKPEVSRDAAVLIAIGSSFVAAGLIGLAVNLDADYESVRGHWESEDDDEDPWGQDYWTDSYPEVFPITRLSASRLCTDESVGVRYYPTDDCTKGKFALVIGLGVSIPFFITAADSQRRVEARHDDRLPPDVLLDHVDRYNRDLARDLDADPTTVGESPAEPDADATAGRVFQTEKDAKKK